MSFLRRLLRRLVDGRAEPPPPRPPPEALTLLDAFARAPAAAALVVAALGQEDRKALRLAHSQLRDAVGEETVGLEVRLGEARPPTARRWPRLRALTFHDDDGVRGDAGGAPEDWEARKRLRHEAFLPAFEALVSDSWVALHTLIVTRFASDEGAALARALAAGLRRMPALRKLELFAASLPSASAASLFRAGMPQLRSLGVFNADLDREAAIALAATGWRLEALALGGSTTLGAAGIAALLSAPTFAICRLDLSDCELDAAALLAVADSAWPLEELDFEGNDLSGAEAVSAIAALSRRAGMRVLKLDWCGLSAAAFKALVEARWPSLTKLHAQCAGLTWDATRQIWLRLHDLELAGGAFAGFPALEELNLERVPLDVAGAVLLGIRRWVRLKSLDLNSAKLGGARVEVLARGEWPALKRLDLRGAGPLVPRGWPLTALEVARRWAPALEELKADAHAAGVFINGEQSESDGELSE